MQSPHYHLVPALYSLMPTSHPFPTYVWNIWAHVYSVLPCCLCLPPAPCHTHHTPLHLYYHIPCHLINVFLPFTFPTPPSCCWMTALGGCLVLAFAYLHITLHTYTHTRHTLQPPCHKPPYSTHLPTLTHTTHHLPYTQRPCLYTPVYTNESLVLAAIAETMRNDCNVAVSPARRDTRTCALHTHARPRMDGTDTGCYLTPLPHHHAPPRTQPHVTTHHHT